MEVNDVKRSSMLFALAGASVLAFAPAVAAQTPPPNHKHYETPAGYDQPKPGQPIAPRLQNLGVHTFPTSTTDSRARRGSTRVMPWRIGGRLSSLGRTSTRP
jgi:hypothetical protein